MKEFFRRHPVLKDALRIGGMLLLLWVLDPFGVATNSDRASEALFYRVVAPRYPKPFDNPEHSTDEKDDNTEIAVIIINDESLANIFLDETTCESACDSQKTASGETNGSVRQATWPPDFSIHEQIVERIFELAIPKALFIDFGFFDNRDPRATEAFVDILKQHAVPAGKFNWYVGCRKYEFQKSDFDKHAPSRCGDQRPIFLPRADADAPEHVKVLEPLRNVVTKVVSTKYIGEEFDSYNQYDLFDCAYGSPPDAAPSAALAMFSVNEKKDPPFSAANCMTGKTPPRKSVYWSDWGSEEHGRGSYACRTLPDGVGGRFWHIFEVWFHDGPRIWPSTVWSWIQMILSISSDNEQGNDGGKPAVDDSTATQFQHCPPFLTVSAHDFLYFLDEKVLADVLRNRYVFYGGNFTMADDLIRPPTHDPIPGVYVHAMVLHNLLNDEDKSAESTADKTILTVITIVVGALLCAGTWELASLIGKSTNGKPANGKPEQDANGQGSSDESLPTTAEALTVRREVCVATQQVGEGLCRVVACVGAKLVLSVGVVLVGYGCCLVAILLLASLAFFYFDLAPINYIGVFSFVVLYGFVQLIENFFKYVFPGNKPSNTAAKGG